MVSRLLLALQLLASAATAPSAPSAAERGTAPATLGRRRLKACVPGQYKHHGRGHGTCADCKPGTYTSKPNQRKCEICRANTYSSPAGTPRPYSKPGTRCIPCPAGSLSPRASGRLADCKVKAVNKCPRTKRTKLIPLNCPTGKYYLNNKQTQCACCPAGKYSDAIGKDNKGVAVCQVCEQNTYSDANDQPSCIACPAGKFTFADVVTGGKDNVVATDVSAGYHTKRGCQATCQPGEYAPGPNSNKCFRCAAGTYSGTARRSACSKCERGKWQNATGAKSCIECEFGKTTVGEGYFYLANCNRANEFTTDAHGFVLGGGLLAGLLVLFSWCNARHQKKKYSGLFTALQESNTQLDITAANAGRQGKVATSIELKQMADWAPSGGGRQLLVTNENVDHLKLGQVLGHGASGVVFLAMFDNCKEKPREVAVKQLDFKENDINTLREVVKEFKAEVEVMLNLVHPNVVQLLGFCTTPKFLVVQEVVKEGTLYDILHDKEANAAVTQTNLMQYALDVAMGMEYLHSFEPPLMHRDLKSPNLLVANIKYEGALQKILKITDFGLARMKGVDGDMKTQVMTQAGTPYWSAPEVLRGEQYNESADVYSAAMVFYEIWARIVPFKGMSPMEVAVQVTAEQDDGTFMRPPLAKEAEALGLPCIIMDLVDDAWDNEPRKRPNFSVICDRIEATAAAQEPPIVLRVERPNRAKEIEFHW